MLYLVSPIYLTLDRTNWKWGKRNLNILTLGIVYQGTAIPVYWLVLNKQGNSNQRFDQPLDVYGLHWEIETLFQCLKGREFYLEETQLTRYFRIKKVMALLAIAFCWAHKTGEWKNKVIRPLKIKKHGRLKQSLFRYGLDHLTDLILHGLSKTENLLTLWALFICSPDTIGFDKQNPERMVFKI